MLRRTVPWHKSGMFLAVAFVSWSVFSRAPEAQSFNQQEQRASEHLTLPLKGADLFHEYCAACHGMDGRGHGPAAAALKPRAPDLTTVARRNRGVFPREQIRDRIVGQDRPAIHGTREMPLWGPIFSQIENDTDYGRVRLENVLLYLKSIQEK